MAKINSGSGGGGDDDDGSSSGSQTSDKQAVERFKQEVKQADNESPSNQAREVGSGDSSRQNQMSNRAAAREFKESVTDSETQQQKAQTQSGADTSGKAAQSRQQAARGARRAVRMDQRRSPERPPEQQQAARRKRQTGARRRAVRQTPDAANPSGRRSRQSGRRALQSPASVKRSGGQGSRRPTESFGQTTDAGTTAAEAKAQFESAKTRSGPVEKIEDYGADLRQRAKENISPIVEIGLSSDQREQAATGERELFRRGERGRPSGAVYTGGEVIQLVGSDVAKPVEEGVTDFLSKGAPKEARTSGEQGFRVDGETTPTKTPSWLPERGEVKQEAAETTGNVAGGATQFPFTVAGGTAQAAVAVREGIRASREKDFSQQEAVSTASTAKELAGRGAKRQVEYAKENPAEAAIILGTPLVLGRGAGVRRGARRVKSTARSAKGRARSAVKSTRQSGEVPRFMADNRGSMQLVPKGRRKGSRGKSETKGRTVERAVSKSEKSEIARQQYEQKLYEQRSRYGERSAEKVPEYKDPVSEGTSPSKQDIGTRSTNPQRQPATGKGGVETSGRFVGETEINFRHRNVPSKDLRAAARKRLGGDEVSRLTPNRDLRAVSRKQATKSRSLRGVEAGAPAGGAASRQAERDLRRRIKQAERPAVMESDAGPPGTEEDTSITVADRDLVQGAKQRQRQAEKAVGAGEAAPSVTSVDDPPDTMTRDTPDTTSRGRSGDNLVSGPRTGPRSRTGGKQTPGEVQTPGTDQPPGPDFPNEPPADPPTVNKSPPGDPGVSSPGEPSGRRTPPPPALPAFPFGGAQARPMQASAPRQTEVVRNPVAAPSEFDEISESIGLDSVPDIDEPGKSKKKKRRKKGDLYDIFDINN